MMRPRRADSGISMILVIVLVLVAIILVVASTVLYAGFAERERQQKALTAEHVRLQNEEAALRAEFQKVMPVVGIPPQGEQADEAKAHALVKAKRDMYFSSGRAEELPTEGGGKPVPAEIKGAFDKKREETALYTTLQELVTQAAWWTHHYKNRAEQLTLDLAIAREQAGNRERSKPDLTKRKEERIKELTDLISTVNQQTAKENEEYTARKNKLTEDRGNAEKETAAENEKFAADEIKVQNEIRELRRQLEELKTREVIRHDITAVHGKVLKPDIPNRTAFLDIGSRDRVRAGLKFMVGKYGVQGRFEYKGKVEVKKAWTTHSEVSIIEVVDPEQRPITEGDLLVNPLFSTKRPVVVAFAGEERPVKLRYSVDEASRRIREIDSDVRKEVALDVDFVVFTEAASGKQPDGYEPFRKALFLEIPVAQAGRTKEAPDRPGIFEFLGD